MRKEDLRKMKRINATPKMMELAKNNNLDKQKEYIDCWGCEVTTKKKTEYDMFIRSQSRGKILMIALFFPEEMAKGKKEPLYEIYINKEGNEFITRILSSNGQEKWSSAKLENLGMVFNKTSISSPYSIGGVKNVNARIWQNLEGKRNIKSFLGTKENGWQGIVEWQKKSRDIKIKEKEDRQQKPWDDDMKLIPPLLPGFKRWSLHDATDENFIFYNYTKSGATSGYCSYCEKQVPIKNPKHNKDGTCPCCKKKIKYKSSGRIQTLERKRYVTECIQKIDGGFVIRSFRVQSWYRDRTPDKPHFFIHEEERYMVMDNGRTKHYSWGSYKNKKMRWITAENQYWNTLWNCKPVLYTRNINALKKSVLKKSAIDMWKKLPCSTAKYLYTENGNPVVEMLARLKMFKLATDFINEGYIHDLLNQNATELAKILQIDKARLKRLRNINQGMESLRWMQFEKTADTIWPDEMIKGMSKNHITPSNLNFLNPPIHYVKAWNYIKKQSKLCDETIAQTVRTWGDYYNMAEQCKWNVAAEQIIYPKNLKSAHSAVILFNQGEDMKKQTKKLEKKWPKVNGILPDIKKFEYSDDNYVIVAPKNILDIVIEGTALSHCVHTCDFYYDRIQKNESYLFFLRKKDTQDVPWYTLEVEPSGNIRQKRTTGDNQNKDFQEAVPFLKKWQKVYKSRLTEEEIELGIIANEARIKEYKKLKKDGNKIWHGKLAGKLLADVLEADFMGA